MSELFCIGEVVINGNVVPAPGALALLGLAGFAALRRRRA
ncbi:MAG: PEP-CTERM sorting domain-containing protein [Phycisphaerales bacterium]|nr:PEP-CTERM sorting domain-containing protein [Phycisphaerales bacterium]